MMPKTDHPVLREGLSTALSCAMALWLGASMLAPRAAVAGDWVTFTDQTNTRIVSDPSVGISDPQEKDLIAGDVDQDGDDDLIIVRKIPFTVAGPLRNVLFMNENGVMTDRSSTLAPDFLDATDDREVALADVDGDGWLDIITAGTFSEQPRILMNLGEVGGAWQGFEYQADRLPVLASPKFCGLGVGDVTGNGRPDIYFADYENNLEDRLLINNGSGFFTDETEARTDPEMVDSTFGTDADIADVNGDGWMDIIKNNSSGTGGGAAEGSAPSPAVIILYNDGAANPGFFSTFDVPYSAAPYMTAPADFTQDGKLDLFIVDDGQDSYLINTGNDGNNHAQFDSHLAGPSPNTTGFGGNVSFADLDNDTILDVLVSDVDTDIPGCGRQLVLLQGQGTPPDISYSDPLAGADRPWTPNGTYDVQAMHINDDGAIDLWIGTCTGNRVLMGFSPDIFEDGFESGDTSGWDSTVP